MKSTSTSKIKLPNIYNGSGKAGGSDNLKAGGLFATKSAGVFWTDGGLLCCCKLK
jgi:hypothetical protein